MLKWLAWVALAITGAYVSIVLLFASYFALAAYIPILARKLRSLIVSSSR